MESIVSILKTSIQNKHLIFQFQVKLISMPLFYFFSISIFFKAIYTKCLFASMTNHKKNKTIHSFYFLILMTTT